MEGSISFAVDSVKNDKLSVTVSGRLTNTRLSNSLDLIVEYSTVFMEELAFEEHFMREMKKISLVHRGIKLEDALFLACLNPTILIQSPIFNVGNITVLKPSPFCCH